MLRNMCLAANGGALADSAGEGHRNNAFQDTVNGLDEHGGSGSAILYLRVNGSWTSIAPYSGSGDPGWSWDTGAGGATVTGPWEKVTGIRIVIHCQSTITATINFPSCTVQYAKWGTNGNGNADLARSFSCEMQAWASFEKVQGQIII